MTVEGYGASHSWRRTWLSPATSRILGAVPLTLGPVPLREGWRVVLIESFSTVRRLGRVGRVGRADPAGRLDRPGLLDRLGRNRSRLGGRSGKSPFDFRPIRRLRPKSRRRSL